MLPAEISPHAKRRCADNQMLSLHKHKGILRCATAKVAEAADPNQMLGQRPGSKAPDPSMTPRQAAQALRDRMAEQVERMVSASILKKMRQEWETVALAVAVALCSRK